MGNRNKNEDTGRGHGLNRHNQIDSFHRWPAGMSFTEAMFQPQTNMDDRFQHGGPYSEPQCRNLTSGEFMPRYSQGSVGTISVALPEQHNSQPVLPNPLSQAEERTPSNVRGGNWSIAEDEKLCHAWVRVSTDPIIGDSQKKTIFWRRVFDDFVRQHGENEHVMRNQKAYDQRFQHIRAECNKWSAALKKVNDHPRSGQNAQDTERAAHAYYRGQNNNKMFKLDHCWEILCTCAKYSETHGALRSSACVPIQDPPKFQCARTLDLGVNEDSPTPTIGKRPPERKASKEKCREKRRQSEDAHSSIGDRIVKSIDDLNASSATEWARSNALNIEEQQMRMRLKRLQMNRERLMSIRERIAIEKELMAIDKFLYSEQPISIGSPNDAKKKLAMRQEKIELLTAQADVFLSDNVEDRVSSHTSTNLNQRFDVEDDNPDQDTRGEDSCPA